MRFWRNEINVDNSESIPDYKQISEMKNNKDLYLCPVEDVSIGDIIFDLHFLKITKSEFDSKAKRAAFHFDALDCKGYTYHAYVFADEPIWALNTEYQVEQDEIISMLL